MKIMASGPITSWQIDGETMETVRNFIFLGSKITVDGVCSHEIKGRLPLGRKAMSNLDSILKKKNRDITLLRKVQSVKTIVYSSCHVGMWELNHKKSWVLKNWCFWTMVLEKTLESPLDYKEIKPFNPKGNQPWMFIGRTDAEAEALILWPPDANNWLIGKDLEAGKDWTQEEKGTTEDEMIGLHHQFNRHEFAQTPGDGKGQGSLACCSPWVTKIWTQLSGWTTTVVIIFIMLYIISPLLMLQLEICLLWPPSSNPLLFPPCPWSVSFASASQHPHSTLRWDKMARVARAAYFPSSTWKSVVRAGVEYLLLLTLLRVW